MKLLNLGCGSRYHTSWTNVDFVSNSPHVSSHNLLNGIPFPDESFDVVYHSHVLEHFNKNDAIIFLKECYRVLKPGGLIRVAVPDLERIVREYIYNLDRAIEGDFTASLNYEWIKLELFDQMVRNVGGGELGKYLFQEVIPNEEYLYERWGEEARNIRKMYFNSLGDKEKDNKVPDIKRKLDLSPIPLIKFILKLIRKQLRKWLFPNEIEYYNKFRREADLGRFRLSGEIHQWMYDRYSLGKVLEQVGFSNTEVVGPFDSKIKNWNDYELESKNGVIYKPDSLFVEAEKI